MTSTLGKLGLGIGWRPEIAVLIDRRQDLDFVEIVAEDFFAPALPAPIRRLRQRGTCVVPHGISLSLGGAEPLDPRRLDQLARLAERLSAPLVSEHIAFVRAGRLEAGHLLPMPRTRAAIEVIVANIEMAKRILPVPLALENIASLFQWPDQQFSEAMFISEILERTNTLLLLDIENVYANARNHHFDPWEFLDNIPLGRLAYVHVAGGIERDGLYHDTHSHSVPPAVFSLLEQLAARIDIPAVMLERDDRFPADACIHSELDAIKGAVTRGAAQRALPPASTAVT